MTEFQLALQDADLLKELKHGGILAREFIRLVEVNQKLQSTLQSAHDLIDRKVSSTQDPDYHIYTDARGYILSALKTLQDTFNSNQERQ